MNIRAEHEKTAAPAPWGAGSFAVILMIGIITGAAYVVGMGNNTAAMIAAIVFFAGVVGLYFAPAVVANQRRHRNTTAITIVDILLGWTVIGWIVALVWAYSSIAPQTTVTTVTADTGAGRKCPFCAETVKAEAIKCRYCGSDISAAAGPPA